VLRARGDGPSGTSPLCLVTGDHSYEIEVDVELLGEGSVEAGLLLYFNDRLFYGMGIDGDRMPSYSGGLRTHWREPAPPARRMRLRIRNEAHIVTSWYALPGEDWVRHAIRYETSGCHANTMGDLQSLRPAIYASGDGEVRFRDLRYRPLR
jgi:xylan 1,4-beta-xylosidase